jgi:hypothetical protein
MNQVTSVVGRILFAGAFLLGGLAVWEKLANLMGLTVVRIYTPARLLELAVIALFFVIALELRDIREQTKGSMNP